MLPSRSTLLILLVVATAELVECFIAPTSTIFLARSTPTRVLCSSSTLSAAAATTPSLAQKGIELANLLYDSTSTAFDAWEWTNGLTAPAALVAGAVLVTLSETRQDLAPRRSDPNWVRVIKLMTRFLLLTSFALEVVSIFVSTVTGTVLLSHGEQVAAKSAKSAAAAIVGYTSPLGLLHHHHEFEYLTIQIGFLQGLFHWLGAVALEFLVPRVNETVSNRRMNHFMASCLFTLIFWILAFYNHHLAFYSDYLRMIQRYAVLFLGRYFGKFRLMSVLYVPSSVASLILGWRAFNTKPELDHD